MPYIPLRRPNTQLARPQVPALDHLERPQIDARRVLAAMGEMGRAFGMPEVEAGPLIEAAGAQGHMLGEALSDAGSVLAALGAKQQQERDRAGMFRASELLDAGGAEAAGYFAQNPQKTGSWLAGARRIGERVMKGLGDITGLSEVGHKRVQALGAQWHQGLLANTQAAVIKQDLRNSAEAQAGHVWGLLEQGDVRGAHAMLAPMAQSGVVEPGVMQDLEGEVRTLGAQQDEAVALSRATGPGLDLKGGHEAVAQSVYIPKERKAKLMAQLTHVHAAASQEAYVLKEMEKDPGEAVKLLEDHGQVTQLSPRVRQELRKMAVERREAAGEEGYVRSREYVDLLEAEKLAAMTPEGLDAAMSGGEHAWEWKQAGVFHKVLAGKYLALKQGKEKLDDPERQLALEAAIDRYVPDMDEEWRGRQMRLMIEEGFGEEKERGLLERLDGRVKGKAKVPAVTARAREQLYQWAYQNGAAGGGAVRQEVDRETQVLSRMLDERAARGGKESLKDEWDAVEYLKGEALTLGWQIPPEQAPATDAHGEAWGAVVGANRAGGLKRPGTPWDGPLGGDVQTKGGDAPSDLAVRIRALLPPPGSVLAADSPEVLARMLDDGVSLPIYTRRFGEEFETRPLGGKSLPVAPRMHDVNAQPRTDGVDHYAEYANIGQSETRIEKEEQWKQRILNDPESLADHEMLESALKDFDDGYISDQTLDVAFAAAGAPVSGTEEYLARKAHAVEMDKQVNSLRAVATGSTESLHGGEGADPRLTGAYKAKVKEAMAEVVDAQQTLRKREEIRAADLERVKKLTERRAKLKPGSIPQWDKSMAPLMKVLPEERIEEARARVAEKIAQLDEVNQQTARDFAPQIAAQEAKYDAILKDSILTPEERTLAKQKALLAGAAEVPKDFWELWGSGDFWKGKTPFAGDIVSLYQMLPAATVAGKLEAGEEVTPEEMALLHETMIELKRPRTGMANVLDWGASGASLAVELATTAGIYTALKEGGLALAAKGLQKLLTRAGLKEVEEMAAKQSATGAVKGGWAVRPGGVRIKQVGNYFIKEVNPDASALGQWWGKGSLEAQSKALGKLGDMAPSHIFKNGRLVMRDAGAYTPGNFWRTWWKGTMRLNTPFNDIRPKNIGAGGIIFDPAKHPIQQGLEASLVPLALGTGAILYKASKD